jgi:RNA polymerase sigma-70 factor (ECF subfamily)
MRDAEARFSALVDQHGSVVLAFLRRLCGTSYDTDDLFQEVAVRVWRSVQSSPEPRNPRAWLMNIAYRVFLDFQARPRLALSPWEDEPVTRAGNGADPAVLTEQKERCQVVQDAMAEVTPAVRSVITLHYTGGLSLREVASALDISVGTVKSRLSAGLEQLRRRLS